MGRLKRAVIEQVNHTDCVPAAEALVEEKAKARLKELFESIDSNKDGAVNQEELARKLSAEHESFKKLLVEAGLNTNLEVFEKLDGDSDKRVTWDEFYGKLKAVAKAEVQGHGDVAAATERTVRIEDAVSYMC